jgi:hypothetical protein
VSGTMHSSTVARKVDVPAKGSNGHSGQYCSLVNGGGCQIDGSLAAVAGDDYVSDSDSGVSKETSSTGID